MAQEIDVVGVFQSSGNSAPMFESAQAMKCQVHEDAKVMQHPMESGAVSSDHIVFLPTEIQLLVIPDPDGFQDAYQEIKDAWKAAKLVTVQTKTSSYPSMLIYRIPHDEDPEMFNTVAIEIRLRQVLIVQAQYAQLPATKVAKPSNASTTKTGTKQGKPATKQQNSAAYDLIFGGR